MITVQHFLHNQVRVSGTIVVVDRGLPNITAIACRYAVGDLPRRYPVPAIIYHVYLPGDPIARAAGDTYGSIWEHSRFHIEPYEVTYNKRVAVLPPVEA